RESARFKPGQETQRDATTANKRSHRWDYAVTKLYGRRTTQLPPGGQQQRGRERRGMAAFVHADPSPRPTHTYMNQRDYDDQEALD
ncbi:unnamed protein product, partial [Ectocarpus sp. 12 AP-2014]